MIHQAELVVGIGVPGPVQVQGPRGLTAFGVAQWAAITRNSSLNSSSGLNGCLARPATVEFSPPPGMTSSGKPDRPPHRGCGCRPSIPWHGNSPSQCGVLGTLAHPSDTRASGVVAPLERNGGSPAPTKACRTGRRPSCARSAVAPWRSAALTPCRSLHRPSACADVASTR